MKWIVVLLVVVGIIVFFIYLKKKQDALEKAFQRRFAGKKIRFMDKYAFFVAQQSDGYSHFRGAGYLVLTDQELYFERQLGNKVVSIPKNSILQVGETRRLGGQCPGKRMLKVDFRTEEGKEDAIAWRVKELERWKDEISAFKGDDAQHPRSPSRCGRAD